ncbi:sensor histidine kinase [Algoriphagus oliviformis]|nr:histidine kinase [Algoriphagus oliviformis]
MQIQYGLELEVAGVDSFVFGLMLMVGLSVIHSMFGYFLPKKENLGQIFGVPLMLSVLGVVGHRYLLAWWYADEAEYLFFLEKTVYLREAMLAGVEVLWAMLSLLASRLEDQNQLNQRESQMLQLSKDAELAQLRQQLQPHFLFNSLNSISALVASQPHKAREMVLQLSEFLRGTIRKDSKSWIPLSEELNYLRMYLDIERVRFGHRLQVDFEVEPELETVKIPQLLIQPLVENAIKHGLYGMTGSVRIDLKCERQENYLALEISNPFDAEAAVPEGTGFGLSSVERRLYLLFGRKDLLSTEASDGLFRVTLKIPQYQ